MDMKRQGFIAIYPAPVASAIVQGLAIKCLPAARRKPLQQAMLTTATAEVQSGTFIISAEIVTKLASADTTAQPIVA